MQKFGQSLTELKTQIASKIINNAELIKALIIQDENFENVIPNLEQSIILNDATVLIRKQIMLTKNITAITDKSMPYITSMYVDFKKKSHNYQSGTVWFYIIIPNSWEKTSYGIRYDYIGDTLDGIFGESGIGKFEFKGRGDMPVDENFMGHYISFNILDFYGW